MTILSTDRAGMERLAHFARYFVDCAEWAEADGRPVFSVETEHADLGHLIADNVFAVTFTKELDGRFTYREFDAASWDAEEDRLCSIAIKRDEAEDAEAEDQEGEE